MAALVIAEHDNGTLKGATLNTVTAALACGGDVHVLVAGANAGGAAQAAAQIAGVAKVLHADGADARRAAGRERRRAGAGDRQGLQPHAVPGHRARQERRAARGREARRRADQRHHQGRQRRHLRAPDLRRQRDRHGAEQRRDQGDHGAHDRLRCRPRPPAAARRSRSVPAVADSGLSSFVGSEIAKSDRPELTAAKIIVSRRPRDGLEREVQRGADAAGRQARRRARRQPRRGRRGLRAQRLAGRARPARSSRRSCTSPAASRARSSTWPA